MKNLAILGSTGSIGKNALEVAKRFPDKFRVRALCANSNIDLLEKQVKQLCPEIVCVTDEAAALRLKARLNGKCKVLSTEAGLLEVCRSRRIDKVVMAISGSDALLPLLTAIESGKDVALANKEALVMAGPIVMSLAAKKKASILPIDSEQSAIWQCLEGNDRSKLSRIFLTASGGPLRNTRLRELRSITVAKVLKHPRWKMGKKITVDSATLMNKGLELLEGMFLFDVPSDRIKVLIHPEAIIHSMVEYVDGVILAQLSVTDMRIPIQYALTYPERLPSNLAHVDFEKLGTFHFQRPDLKRFPCLGLAYQAARELGTLPAVLNAANEVSVQEFLKGRLKFIAIPKVIEKVMRRHHILRTPSLADIKEADRWAKTEAFGIIANVN